MDRASDFYSDGCGFKSCRVRQSLFIPQDQIDQRRTIPAADQVVHE